MQAYIAPLQPAALAAFPPWGSSQGAGRADLRCKFRRLTASKKVKTKVRQKKSDSLYSMLK